MLLIKNNDDTPVTIKTYSSVDPLKTHYYLKFIDSSGTNTKILEVLNQSTQPKYYSRFLILENSNIPAGRGIMEFYAATQTGLTKLNIKDLINSQEYELKAANTYQIVQYVPGPIEYIYYRQSFTLPMQSFLLRRLSKKRGTDLVDSINNANAQILLPVSEFDGVDGCVKSFVFPNLDQVNKITININTDSNQYVLLRGQDDSYFLGTNSAKVGSPTFSQPMKGAKGLLVIENIDFSTWTRFEISSYGHWELEGSLSDFKFYENEELLFTIPLPHLGVGFDAQGNKVNLAITGGVAEGFDKQGTSYYQDADPTKLNTSSALLVLFKQGQLQEEYAFFDTSNTAIWKSNFEWNASIITQSFIDSNIQDAYKNRLFISIKNDIIVDILLYSKSLNETQLISLNNYLNQ